MTFKRICLIINVVLAIAVPHSVSAQGSVSDFADPAQPLIDSILSLITPDIPDNEKAQQYYKIAEITNNIDTRQRYAQMSLDHCGKSDTHLILQNAQIISYCYYVNGQYDLLKPFLQENIDLAIKCGELFQLQKLYRIKAMYYEQVNNNDSIFFYLHKALEICIADQDSANLAGCYQELGLKYINRKFFKEAEINYRKGMEIDSIIGNVAEYAIICHRMGELYYVQDNKDYYTAKKYLTKSARIFDTISSRSIRHIISKYLAYNSLADVYIHLAENTGNHDYADSCYYYNSQALNYFLSSGYSYYYCYLSMTHVEYLKFYKKYQEALEFMLELEKSIDKTNIDLLNTYYFKLRNLYYELGDYKKAYDCFEKNYATSTALTNDSAMNKVADAKAEQAVMIEKIERKNAELVHASEKRMMLTLIFSLIGGLVLTSMLIFYIYRNLKIKKEANLDLAEKNTTLNQQKTEISAQRDEIEHQRDELSAQRNRIEGINRQLVSSINYAERIQRAAVTSIDDLHEIFPDSFVFYRPRDIVSGDFYRAVRCGRYRVMITADCTGHGIPGAFLSMLGISALKEFMVTEHDAENPGLVLDGMREFIISTLSSTNGGLKIDDGMDMTICCFDFDNMLMHYGIANQKAYIVRHGETIKLSGDNMPVGRYLLARDHFRSFSVPIQKGDMVYMFSDGIPDQLGGPEEKKFLIRNLLALLSSFAQSDTDTQCSLIDKTITDWRGNTPQVDDMTLVGIRV
ncbi:MAG: serine/threonine-protein phosphatase [Bacteroidales bacterium]|nr:serine/threonine-protein phosphatase [Bacteroidales bacterium]